MSWLDNPPRGLFLVKAMHLLRVRGYQIAELSSASKTIISLMEAISVGKATIDEARAASGYRENDSLYRVIFGKNGCSPIVIDALENFVISCQQNPALNYLPKAEATSEKPEQLKSDKPGEFVIANLIKAFDHTGLALLPFLESLINKSGADERQEIRNQLGEKGRGIFPISNNLFRISQLLNALCSEKAREGYLKKKH